MRVPHSTVILYSYVVVALLVYPVWGFVIYPLYVDPDSFSSLCSPHDCVYIIYILWFAALLLCLIIGLLLVHINMRSLEESRDGNKYFMVKHKICLPESRAVKIQPQERTRLLHKVDSSGHKVHIVDSNGLTCQNSSGRNTYSTNRVTIPAYKQPIMESTI